MLYGYVTLKIEGKKTKQNYLLKMFGTTTISLTGYVNIVATSSAA